MLGRQPPGVTIFRLFAECMWHWTHVPHDHPYSHVQGQHFCGANSRRSALSMVYYSGSKNSLGLPPPSFVVLPLGVCYSSRLRSPGGRMVSDLSLRLV